MTRPSEQFTEAAYEAAFIKRQLRQPLTLHKTGLLHGLSRTRVMQIQNSALAKIRAVLERELGFQLQGEATDGKAKEAPQAKARIKGDRRAGVSNHAAAG